MIWSFGYVGAFVQFLEAAKQCNMPQEEIEKMRDRFIYNLKNGKDIPEGNND